MNFSPIYLYNLPRQPVYEAQLAIRAGQIASKMKKAGNRIGKNKRSVDAILDKILRHK